MKNLFSVALVFLMLFVSCASSHKVTDASQRDGSSYDKAIVIEEKNESTGVKAEYNWLTLHYPGYISESQTLSYHNKHPFDILNIKTSTGTPRKVYFDISNYFGKW